MSLYRAVEFFTPGTPAPQGSKSVAFIGGRCVMRETSTKTLKPWREAIRTAAIKATQTQFDWEPLNTPVLVELEFWFPRPKSVIRAYPAVKPDIDKIARAALDAMTNVVYTDDARVVSLFVSKRYVHHPAIAKGREPLVAGLQVTVAEHQ